MRFEDAYEGWAEKRLTELSCIVHIDIDIGSAWNRRDSEYGPETVRAKCLQSEW